MPWRRIEEFKVTLIAEAAGIPSGSIVYVNFEKGNFYRGTYVGHLGTFVVQIHKDICIKTNSEENDKD